MSDWTDDDRARYDEAKRIIKSGDTEALVEYISGLPRETIDRVGGFGTCVTHHYCDCTGERIKQLEAGRDRLLSANDTLVARIEDMMQGYATSDTCPRVQCRSTSKRLSHALTVSREHCIEQGRRIETLQDERDGLRNGNRDLHEECQRLRRERDDAINERKLTAALANEDYAEKAYQANRYEQALRRIAADDTSVYNADGTYSIGTDALIQIAADALNDHTDSE